MTSAPPKDWIAPQVAGQNAGQQGFGVDYFGAGADLAQAGEAAFPAQSWVQRVRGNAGMPAASPLTPAEQSTLDQTELSIQYPDLTAEEWRLLHNPEDLQRLGFSLAEEHKTREIQIEWVKSTGTPIRTEVQNGVVAHTWERGGLRVYEVIQPDGTSQNWFTHSGKSNQYRLEYHLGPDGGVMYSSTHDGYAVAMQRLDNSLYLDCTISSRIPQKPVPLSGDVNGRKGDVGAYMGTDGLIRITSVQGTVRPYDFILKISNGIFVTVDANGTPILADLEKLPPEIELTPLDKLNHHVFANRMERGEAALSHFIRPILPQEKSPYAGMTNSEGTKHEIRQRYNQLNAWKRSGQLANAPISLIRDDSAIGFQPRATKSSFSR